MYKGGAVGHVDHYFLVGAEDVHQMLKEQWKGNNRCNPGCKTIAVGYIELNIHSSKSHTDITLPGNKAFAWSNL